MTVQTPDTLKSYFSLGKVPTPSNYDDLIDTIFEKSIVGNIATEHVNITNTAVQLKDGDIVYTELAGGSLTLGLITKDHILVASSGIKLKENTVVKIDLQADGDVFIGEDVSAASTTFMSIFSNSQIYNNELISGGDVLLGDNSLSKANILWDKSAGKLLFRGGTVTQAEIDTTGAIVAGSGNVIIDSTGITVAAEGVGYGGDEYRYKIKNGTGTMLEMRAYEGSGAVPWFAYITATGMAISHEIDLFIEADNGAIFIRPYVGGGYVTNIQSDTYVSTDLRVGAGLYVGDSALETNPTSGEITATNKIYINDSSNDKMTQGITINQGANDNEILSFKSSDIAHGMTDVTETDTYGLFQKNNASYGSLKIMGLQSTVAPGLILIGYGAIGNTDKSTTGVGEVVIYAGKKNGTATQALSTDENILTIRNYSDAYFFFDASGNFTYHGALQSYKNSTAYKGYIYVPLQSALTSTNWDGDSYSTVASSTLIDLSSEFGVPAGVKAVLLQIIARDSASWGTSNLEVMVGPTSGYYYQMSARPVGGDVWAEACGPVNCDDNGDIYYRITASGSSTMDVYMRISGYWI